VLYCEIDPSRITPHKPYNFALKKNGADESSNVDWLGCSVAVEELLISRDKDLAALSQLPKASRVYKPGI
ncbi:hypothetical protein LX36DRAFT_594184, partial [Colletotrichum falcatum]